MNCLQSSDLADAITLAAKTCGGNLTEMQGGWQWLPANESERAVHIRPGQNLHRLALDPLGAPATLGTSMEHLNATLGRWIRWSGSLPPGIGITVQNDSRPLFLAAVPAEPGDMNQLAGAFEGLLRGFGCLPATLDDEPVERPSLPPHPENPGVLSTEAILAWADDTGLSIESSDGAENPDDGNSESSSRFTVKLPGTEPASLVIGDDRVSLAISAAPDVGPESPAPVAEAACALLALSIGNRLPLIRAAFASPSAEGKSLGYQATISRFGDNLPPAAWLRRATSELTSALRTTRRELEALHASPALASNYLSARGFDLESAAPS